MPMMINAAEKFEVEYAQSMRALSIAVTEYAKASLPEELRKPSPVIEPYLNRGVTIGLRYRTGAPIELVGRYGVFQPVRQIPLTEFVYSHSFPATIELSLDGSEGLAVEAALVAVSDLLDRVDSFIEAYKEQAA